MTSDWLTRLSISGAASCRAQSSSMSMWMSTSHRSNVNFRNPIARKDDDVATEQNQSEERFAAQEATSGRETDFDSQENH